MRRHLVRAALLANTLLLLTFAYLAFTDVDVGRPRYAVYGLLWIAVGVGVVGTVRTPPASRQTKRRAAALGVGYFSLLAVAGGIVTTSGPAASGLRVSLLPPGWGPALVYAGSTVNVILMPARVVGYLALAHLVYAAALDAAEATVSGIVGLFSCVSCSWPILASIATSALGSGSALAGAATALSYDLSTAVFLLTVALLHWRPFVGSTSPRNA